MKYEGLFAATMMRLLFLWSSMLLRTTHAFRIGAGTCLPGTDALLQPNSPIDLQTHGTLEQIGTGPIQDYGLRLEIDGRPLDPTAGASSSFSFGEEHVLSLVSTNEAYQFTGFLIRLESPDGDRTIEALEPLEVELEDGSGVSISTNGDVQVEQKCRSVHFVGGVTHTSRALKQRVDVLLYMEGASSGLELDVSVVVKTSTSSNISEWYYSRFILDAVEATPAPSMAPSNAPSPGTSNAPSPNIDTESGDGGSSSSRIISWSYPVGLLVTGVLLMM
jgi:hypothetical protein